jgi:MHS family metabolite:H+ symporter-like MFS transporter
MNTTSPAAASHEPASAADSALATREGRGQFIRATLSCWLGTMMEYVDFALYGLAAGLVFGDVFFPQMTPLLALLASFATYSVGFIARPLGAWIFGLIGDRKGRQVVLITTVTLMGLSTTLIGLVPPYSRIGVWAPLCLVALRFMQGFGAGAELSGGAVMLAEYAPARRRGLIASIVALGSNSGTLLASLVWLLVLQLDKADLMAWGWRVPFLCSILIAGVAIFLRRQVPETPVFQQALQQNQQRRGSAAAVADQRGFLARNRAFWIMLGLRIGENGPSYLCQGFLVGYVAKVLLVDKSVPALAVLIASLCGFVVIPLSGWLSDRFGRRIVYRCFCLLLVLYAFPAFMLLQTRNPAIVIAVIVVGMCIASLGIFGAQAAYGVELFGVQGRYTRMALAKELGSILSGGTAPLVATALLTGFGHWWPLACYFVLMAGIGLATTFAAPETRGRDLNLLEDAQ